MEVQEHIFVNAFQVPDVFSARVPNVFLEVNRKTQVRGKV